MEEEKISNDNSKAIREMTLEEKAENKARAMRLLERLKKIERKTTFYTKKLNNNTLVCCKREERLNDYK